MIAQNNILQINIRIRLCFVRVLKCVQLSHVWSGCLLDGSYRFMCTSHSLRAIYVLCSCIDVFNLVGFVLSLRTLRVVWSSGYKTSNFSRSLHEVEVSTFMYNRVDFVLLCERGFRGTYETYRGNHWKTQHQVKTKSIDWTGDKRRKLTREYM